MVELDFGGIKETVITRNEFPVDKAKKILKNETVATLGYGIQGRAQSLNMRDNGINVIVGQSKKFPVNYQQALDDGWIPGETLFSLEEAAERGTIKQYLLTDAAQKALWPVIKSTFKDGDALYFSHGFSIVYRKLTGVIDQVIDNLPNAFAINHYLWQSCPHFSQYLIFGLSQLTIGNCLLD